VSEPARAMIDGALTAIMISSKDEFSGVLCFPGSVRLGGKDGDAGKGVGVTVEGVEGAGVGDLVGK